MTAHIRHVWALHLLHLSEHFERWELGFFHPSLLLLFVYSVVITCANPMHTPLFELHGALLLKPEDVELHSMPVLLLCTFPYDLCTHELHAEHATR